MTKTIRCPAGDLNGTLQNPQGNLNKGLKTDDDNLSLIHECRTGILPVQVRRPALRIFKLGAGAPRSMLHDAY